MVAPLFIYYGGYMNSPEHMTVTIVRNSKLKIIPSLKLAYRGYRGRLNTFDFNGNQADLYIDEDLWVLIATSIPPGGAIPVADAILPDANNIISSAIAANIPDIASIRISDTGQATYDIRTSSATVIGRLQNYQALSYIGGQNQWTTVKAPANASYRVTCVGGSNNPLNNAIYHSCGDQNGLHWIPSGNFNRIRWNVAGNSRFELWVKG